MERTVKEKDIQKIVDGLRRLDSTLSSETKFHMCHGSMYATVDGTDVHGNVDLRLIISGADLVNIAANQFKKNLYNESMDQVAEAILRNICSARGFLDYEKAALARILELSSTHSLVEEIYTLIGAGGFHVFFESHIRDRGSIHHVVFGEQFNPGSVATKHDGQNGYFVYTMSREYALFPDTVTMENFSEETDDKETEEDSAVRVGSDEGIDKDTGHCAEGDGSGGNA